MHALTDFFSTDYGLLSALVIALTLGMGGFYLSYFLRHIRQDTEAAEQAARAAGVRAR
ncbi:MAG: hypothetical protein RLZZ592_1783 [Pseudomonadota bacterium]|jgi:hypothetical protein